MKHLITGVAAIALMAAAAHGQGNSQGKGNDGDHSKHAAGQSMKGSENKGGKSDQGKQAKADRGEGNARQVARGNEGKGQGKAERKDVAKAGDGEKNRGNSASKADRGDGDRRVARKDDDERGIRVLDDGRRIFERPRDRDEFAFLDSGRGLVDGCPPGLAKKNNGCLPPGQARQDDRFDGFGPEWWGLGSLGDGRYLYNDGHQLRLNGDRRLRPAARRRSGDGQSMAELLRPDAGAGLFRRLLRSRAERRIPLCG
jgi:hypothetical protein